MRDDKPTPPTPDTAERPTVGDVLREHGVQVQVPEVSAGREGTIVWPMCPVVPSDAAEREHCALVADRLVNHKTPADSRLEAFLEYREAIFEVILRERAAAHARGREQGRAEGFQRAWNEHDKVCAEHKMQRNEVRAQLVTADALIRTRAALQARHEALVAAAREVDESLLAGDWQSEEWRRRVRVLRAALGRGLGE